jgi:hypothetical protein
MAWYDWDEWPWNWGSGTISDPLGQPRASKFTVIFGGSENALTLVEEGGGVPGVIARAFRFQLGPNLAGAGSEPVILSFNLANADPVSFQISLNGSTHLLQHYSSGPERSVHVVTGLDARNGTNLLILRSSKGSCTISNFVIWYQVLPVEGF